MEKTCVIKQNSELGRYVTAAKSLRAGEILFQEIPFAYGPKQDSPVVCLNCYCPLDGTVENGQRCKKCTWPLCEECANLDENSHFQYECELFTKFKVTFQNSPNITERCTQMDCITPLRVLLHKENDPDRWEQEVAMMEDHEKERKNSDTWINDDNNIVKYLQGPCKLKERFSEDLIQKVIGILEVNAFEAKTCQGYSIRCLYPKLAILAHSCCPNTTHSSFPSERFKLVVRATINVAPGEMLNLCYTHTLEGTSARQLHLKEGKFFTCKCKRCIDPTELETHFSSLKCTKCDLGLILSTNPLEDTAEWKCTHCEFKTMGAAVQKAIRVMQADINRLNEMNDMAEKLQQCEEVFKKYRSVLHPRHFIQTTLRHILIELYGRADGYGYDELPDILLEHKAELCRDVLKVLEIVEPGKTRSRAMMLYELHVPLIMHMKSGFSTGKLSSAEMKKRIEEIIGILEEVAEILDWEDKQTQEGMLAEISQNAVAELKLSLLSIK